MIWTDESVETVKSIIEYLEENISLQSAQNFEIRLFDAKEFIVRHPTAGRPSASPNVRYWLIDRHRRIYYEHDETNNLIFILDIFDTRQDPNKLNY